MHHRAIALASAVLSGCAAQDLRGAWMREVLVDADRSFLSREPALVAYKYREMSAGPYPFLRGSLPWYCALLTRPEADRARTAFLQVPEATSVLLIGDPHPENLSTQRPDPTHDEPSPPQSVEFIDLDAATWGPWTFDLRRAALGLRALAHQAGACEGACGERAVEALALAYAAQIEGRPPPPARGRVLEALLAEAREEGPEQRRTVQRTAWLDPQTGAPTGPDEGERVLVRAGPRGEIDAGLTDLVPSEAALLEQVIAGMGESLPPDLRVLDATRRYGAGVSSLPALRFALLVDRGDPGPEDDALLTVREVLDPPAALPGRATHSPGSFADNADRVNVAADHLWSRADNDALRAGACVGAQCFKSLSWTSWFQDVERDDVAEDVAAVDLIDADFVDLGRDVGRLLAAEHRRGLRSDGGDPGAAIRRDLTAGGGETVLAAELVELAEADLAQLQADHRLFVRLLREHGPLLGATDREEHTP